MFEQPDILDSTSPSAAMTSILNHGHQHHNHNHSRHHEHEKDNSKASSTPPASSSLETIAELNAEKHLKSLKRKPFTAGMSLLQKRLRKKAKLQKILNLNKNKYNSLSSSSSFSSLSSSSSSFSQISAKSLATSKHQPQEPPLKLHKFYHSVPFKCPFCFTFKESPGEFIDHMAETHHSDVKLLYEKKCTVLIENMSRKEAAKSEEQNTGEENNCLKQDKTVESTSMQSQSVDARTG